MSDGVAAISPVSFWVPDYICPSAWIEHAPFAFWICEALRPARFIELGTHYGYSYFAFCQAIDRLGLGTTAYAVDTWKGDEHAGFYDESVFRSVATRSNDKYAAFSSLIRSTFAGALDYFADGSIDLLHIDGRHFYDDVKHDFTLWRPKLIQDAVVLFHDTNVREREFGVWKFFEEVAAQHPSFQFFHGHGVGLLILGDRVPAPLAPLIQASRKTADQIRSVYAALGGALTARAALGERAAAGEAMQAEIGTLHVAVARAQQEAHERAAAGEAMQVEIGTLHDTLACAQQEAHERAAAGEAMQAEIGTLHDALAEAERLRQECDAASTSLQAQVTALNDQLAITREVGSAALASLRSEATMLPEAPRNAGWLTPVLRLFGFRDCLRT